MSLTDWDIYGPIPFPGNNTTFLFWMAEVLALLIPNASNR
jgi:hypothetical protein